MIFLNYFFKTLAILFAFTFFIIVIGILGRSIDKNKKESFSFLKGKNNSENTIAILNLNGPIINYNESILSIDYKNIIIPEDTFTKLAELKEINPKIIIIKLNTPGGTVSASVKLYNMFREFKKNTKAELIFFSDQILTSGGYWVASSGDKIYASYGTILGSIGVSGPSWIFYDNPTSMSSGIFGQTIVTENGIKLFSQKSGYSKDLFNPFRKPNSDEIDTDEIVIRIAAIKSFIIFPFVIS